MFLSCLGAIFHLHISATGAMYMYLPAYVGILLIISFCRASSIDKISFHHLNHSESDTVTIITHANSESFEWRQLLSIEMQDASDSIHLVFTDASQSPLYGSSLKSINASHIVVCTSTLCHGSCHACIANTTVTPRTSMAAALAALRDLNVSSLVVLYDETASSSMWNLADFLSNASLIPHVSIRVDLSRNETVEHLRRTLRSVMSDATRQYRHFVVLCTETATRAVLREVSRVAPSNGLLNRQFFWIVLSPIADAARLLEQLPSFANVLIMRNHRPACIHTQLSSIRSAVDVATRAAAACSASDRSCHDSVRHMFQKYSSNSTRVDLLASITTEIGDSSATKWKEVATYSTTFGSLVKKSALFPNTFVDFAGRTLKLASILYQAEVITTNRSFVYKNVTCHVLVGPIIDFLNVLSQKLNFKTCYVYPPDEQWGNYNEKTGKATGMIGMAYRHEVDLVANLLSKLHSRALAIDFSHPVMNFAFGIIIRRQEASKSMFHILHPFDWSVWLSFSCAVAVIGVVNWSLSRMSPCSGVNLQLSTAIKDEVQLRHNIWNSLGFVLEQGQENMPFAISSRLVTICMWVFCVVISILYSSNLFTLLYLRDTQLPIENLEDFSKQNEIRLLIKPGSHVDNLFETSKDEAMQRVNRKAVRHHGDADSSIEIVRSSSHQRLAVAEAYKILRGFEAQDCQTLAVLPETFMNELTVAFAWPRNSFFADKMNALIQTTSESGAFVKEYDKILQREYGSPCVKLSEKIAKFSPTDMTNLTGIIALLGVFIAIAVVALTVEAHVWTRFEVVSEEKLEKPKQKNKKKMNNNKKKMHH